MSLKDRIASLVEAQGPMSIADFMTLALHDPNLGYYAAHDPIGSLGDFITAPEVSQMFGELLGLWIVQAWRDQGSPSLCRLVELGPGRGTLTADALRAARLDPAFLSSIEVVLIESSPRLCAAQAETLKDCGKDIRWFERFDGSLVNRPLFVLANEFFDALPIRQYVMTDRGWCERMIGLDAEGNLVFALSPVPVQLVVPSERGRPEIGAVYETCPMGEAIVGQVAQTIAKQGGAALIVDYGYGANSGFGETLQAVSQHKYANILDTPGDVDLSTHVDFAALARAAARVGAKAHGPVEQGEFLRRLGIIQRAEALSHNDLHTVDAELRRLIDPDEMGRLFKAFTILPKTAPKPEGF